MLKTVELSRKSIKKIIKITLWTTACLLLLLVAVVFSLRYRPVQNYLAQKTAKYLSKELGTTVSLTNIYFRPFSSLVVDDLFIADLDGDTLLFAGQMRAGIDLAKLTNREITITSVSLKNTSFHLKKHQEGSNITFLQTYFAPSKGTPKKKSDNPLAININRLKLENIRFAYQNLANPKVTRGVNFTDILLTDLSGDFMGMDFTNHLFHSTVRDLKFKEKSGFRLRELNAVATLDSNGIVLENLYIETNRSRLRDYLSMSFADFSAFENFIEEVTIEANLDGAFVSSRDIEFFAPTMDKVVFDVYADATLSGTVSDIDARNIRLRTGISTQINGDLSVTGLPDIDKTIFDARLTQFRTNAREIESIVPMLGNGVSLKLPDFVAQLGDFTYEGTFTGFYNDFNMAGLVDSRLGRMTADVDIEIGEPLKYVGSIQTTDFDLGQLLEIAPLGSAGFELSVDGRGTDISSARGDLSAQIDFLDLRGYRYKGITIAGTVLDQVFSGEVVSNDSNADLQFDAVVDYGSDNPDYSLLSTVSYVDLHALNLYEKDTLIFTQGEIAAQFTGTSFNDLQGGLHLQDVHFTHQNDSFHIEDIALSVQGIDTERVISLRSDIADGTLQGEVDLNTFGSYFKTVLMRYAPAMQLDAKIPGIQDFEVEIHLKDFRPLARFVSDNLSFGKGFVFDGHFSSKTTRADFELTVPQFSYGNINVNDLYIVESAVTDSMHVKLNAERVSLSDSLYIDEVFLSSVLADNALAFTLKLANDSAANRLNLSGMTYFERHQPAHIAFLPSEIVVNDMHWLIENDAAIRIHPGRIEVSTLKISNAEESVLVDGIVSDQDSDILSVHFDNLNLDLFNALTGSSTMKLGGVLNGNIDLFSVLDNPFGIADIIAEDIKINSTEIGNLALKADYEPLANIVNLNMDVTKNDIQTMQAQGTYHAVAETDKLDVDMAFNQIELIVFQPILSSLISDVKGKISAQLKVTGTFLEPKVTGSARFHDAGFIVNYLKTPYRINDEIAISNSTISLHDLEILDPYEHHAVANGTIDMRNPIVPEIDVRMSASNFLILNTTYKDNPLYYGTAFGTGTFEFRGPTDAMNINIKATSNANTSFSIPLNATGTVHESDFINFVGHDSTAVTLYTSPFLKGMTMNMDLQITPDAEANIHTDLGELSGKGEGLISLRISSLGDFGMFGDYVINEGKFTFTAQDFINKIFEINRGGSIRWTGQPTEASIKLTAVYEQRTSVAPLYNAAGVTANEQRVLAQAQMNLSGILTRPEISFGLNFPNEPYVKDELQSYLSDINNINQQALSLIVRRSFAPGSSSDFSRELNSTLLSAGTELAFNQLNNIIAQSLNLKFVDLNIRSLNDASASFRFFNDRLVFTGGVTDMRNLQLHDFNVFGDRIATDAELLYLLRKDGRLILRGSNRLNTRNFLLNPNNDEYVSAVGLIYRQEFNTLNEFIRRLLLMKPKEAEDEKEN